MGSKKAEIEVFHKHLAEKYKVKGLGRSTRYLEWAVTVTNDGRISLRQTDMADAMIEKSGMWNENGIPTPYIYCMR